MEWVVGNVINCVLEGISMIIIWRLLESYVPRKWEYIRTLVTLVAMSLLVTWTDFSGLTLLPINFALVLISFLIGFYRLGFRKILMNLLFAYLALIDMQLMLICLLPNSWIDAQMGYLLGNGLILGCAVGMTVLSRRYHWKTFYRNNTKTIWLCIVTLCVPTIATAQIADLWIGQVPRSTLVILFLLQLLYLSVVVVIFLLSNRKSEQKQRETTQKYINELNAHLEDSRRNIHDFNKHLRYLRNAVVTNSENEKLTDLVNSYCDKLLTIYDEEEVLLQLDSPLFRALLYGRRSQAKHEHIQFQLNATELLPDFPVQSYQLVEIFDNLMDNAFESVRELPEEQRWIRVMLSVTLQENGQQCHMLCIENSYNEVDLSNIVSDRPYSSKVGHQGVGLQHVSRLVSDTGGHLILRAPNTTQEKMFSVKVQYDVSSK